MWPNLNCHKFSLSTCQRKPVAVKGKQTPVKEENVVIPASWDLAHNQKLFIESFLDTKSK